MKRFTFLMSLLLISGIIFGQALVPKRTKDFMKIKGDPIEETKELTIIWEDDFSDSTLWVTAYEETNPNDGPWVIGTDGPAGYYSGGMGPIESTTADNGFAMYDSDAIGLEAGTQDSKLIYHTSIDCSAHSAVAVSFESYYRAFHGSCYIEVSTDSSTWEQFQVHEDIQVNSATANPELVTVNISAVAANQAEVFFRFRYIGEWDYAWMVDDIKFFVAPDHDLKMLDARVNFYPKYINYGYSGFYGKIPKRQFQSVNAEIFFNGVVKNLGTQNASPSINTTVLNPNNDEIFNHSADLGALLATGENDTIELGETLNVTEPMLGTYTWNFEAYEDGVTEENPPDNTISYQTEITPNYYAHNNGNVTGGWSTENYTNGGSDGDIVGVIYTFLEPDTIKKAFVYISSMTSVNTSFVVKILSWDDASNEWTEQLSSGVQNISDESQTGTLWEVPFPGVGYYVDPAGELEEVMVAVEYYYSGAESFRLGIDGTVPTSGFETYMYFISESTWYYYGGDHVPIIDIETYDEGQSIEDMLNADLSIYPNPNQGSFVLEMGLTQKEDVDLTVISNTGQVVYHSEIKDVNSINRVIDFGKISDGVYTLRIKAGSKFMNQKIIINK
ncbi:MAG: T9SS type A sorting domain-containing protein [Bacteroidales bacterium]